MTVEIEVGGRRRTVSVEKRGDGWAVTLDGRSAAVHAAVVDGRWSLLVEDARSASGASEPVSRRSYEVTFDGGGGDQLVRVDGCPVRLALIDPRRRYGRRDVTARADGPGAVVAPMPGRVVRILVARGQQVAARQGVVVVEAMKMENELKADAAGVVARVAVAAGQAVEKGAIMIEFEVEAA